MSDQTSRFVGNIPEDYDHVLGPVLFADYAEHTARPVAGYALPACWKPAPGPA